MCFLSQKELLLALSKAGDVLYSNGDGFIRVCSAAEVLVLEGVSVQEDEVAEEAF